MWTMYGSVFTHCQIPWEYWTHICYLQYWLPHFTCLCGMFIVLWQRYILLEQYVLAWNTCFDCYPRYWNNLLRDSSATTPHTLGGVTSLNVKYNILACTIFDRTFEIFDRWSVTNKDIHICRIMIIFEGEMGYQNAPEWNDLQYVYNIIITQLNARP